MFVGIHTSLALMTKTPELALTPEEGADFMKAATKVLSHYPVQTTQKTLDWIAFFGVAGGIYGTRAFAIANRRAEERKDGRAPVIDFPSFRAAQAERSKPDASKDAASVAPAAFVPSVPPGEPDAPGF